MQSYRILENIINQKLAVIIRGDNRLMAEKTVEACIAGGAKTLEITFTIPGASSLIQALNDKYNEIIIGAGTVLDSETARIAISSGAQFIVSPAFDKETAKLCNRYSIPYIPGCMTVNEMLYAVEYGIPVMKLFPGNAFDPSFIKAIHGPLPHVSIMPTGGVSLNNAQQWLDAGAVMLGVGGEITNPAKKGKYSEVERLTRSFLNLISKE